MLNIPKFLLLILTAFFTPQFVSAAPQSAYNTAVIRTSLHQTPVINHLKIIEGATVKMVVFTTYNGYQTSDTSLGATIWTTVAPDVQQRCTEYVKQQKKPLNQQALNRWVAKLLGLPAEGAERRRFVELVIPVTQAYYGSSAYMIGIFRPCTDPRIGSHHDDSDICPTHMNPNDKNVSSDYKTWFINSAISAHTSENGMPWTERGFTYDWNDNAGDHVGVSEFVVLKGTPVSVLANPMNASTPYINAEQYCGNNKL